MQSHQLDCEESEKNLGDSRVKELYNQTSHFILRRTQEIINQYLPKKQEIILFCKITDTQRQIYQAALDYYEKQKYTDNKDVVHLQLINCLKKICNHPILLSQDAAKDEANIGELNKYLLETITNRNLEISDSGKVKIILNLLKEVYDKKEKIVVVSYFIQTLNMLANLCKSKGYIYARYRFILNYICEQLNIIFIFLIDWTVLHQMQIANKLSMNLIVCNLKNLCFY